MTGEWRDPPAEFSLMPFWFWNDALEPAELVRQIDDFERHGVRGFVIHPRVGLPRDCGWMSERLLGFIDVALEAAACRGMRVLLYDEGMYPSGSSSGQVVALYPHLACRGLALHRAADPLPDGARVVGEMPFGGELHQIVDRTVDAYVRGLHYIEEGPAEDEPPAGDLLNPACADAVIELVYEVYARRFGQHFGATILGIFTDEPNPLAKCREAGVQPGTTGIIAEVSRLLGYEFGPRLPELWAEGPAGEAARAEWHRGIRLRMNETWFRPLSDWCTRHGIALCGHPDRGDEIGAQHYFHIPGQDLVWRWVEPGQESSTRGHESTQGKCSSSAMIHLGRRRNSNEFGGAYGAQTTFEEVRGLAWWCIVRGVNLLIPHAFYYSVRGPRRDERPPQIGPHTAPWHTGAFKAFADACRRLCWLNTDCTHLCHVAILTHGDRCPWSAADVLLTHQLDFNYVEPSLLCDRGASDPSGIEIGGMRYRLLIIDGVDSLPSRLRAAIGPALAAGRVVRWVPSGSLTAPDDGISHMSDANGLAQRAASVSYAPEFHLETSAPTVRCRRVEKGAWRFALLFNEGLSSAQVQVCVSGEDAQWLDPATARATPCGPLEQVVMAPLDLRVVRYNGPKTRPS